jgi:hypothetical protein
MDPSSIVLYYEYKTLEEGTPLKQNNGCHVRDIDGKKMMCVGGWKSPSNVEQCRSAISTLHDSRYGCKNQYFVLDIF